MRYFPLHRLRRNRQSKWTRDLVRENVLTTHDLILPLFVQEGQELKTPISSLPECNRYSIDELVKVALEAQSLGIPAIALFPYIDASLKTNEGEEALNPNNLICRCIQTLKNEGLKIGIIADVALDPYTTHGQDGIVKLGCIDNDLTVTQLVKQALVLAEAGADVLAPSDMMDGRVGAIRQALEAHDFKDTIIMSYTAKYASHFYGPFREAVGSKGQLGKQDKTTYQMDPANKHEASLEVNFDIDEGADWFIVKPGMPYLDVVAHMAKNIDYPVFAYQVSGEHFMLHSLAEKTNVSWMELVHESLLGCKRAGATGILCYSSIQMAKWLQAKI